CDKFALYPGIGRISGGRLHLKTSGTSWLEAVRIIAEHDPVLYRVIHKAAWEGYEEMSRIYHTSADISAIRNVDDLYDDQLPGLLDQPAARQMLHITFGVILNNKFIRPLFLALLYKYEHEYIASLKKRFERHLQLLGIPKKQSPQQ
ncbi:MAG: tagaturonate epimerase family protein, partial [Victivallales bacterium]|nr:tagaturonate epimerase family protein [Victivallales bacterium]